MCNHKNGYLSEIIFVSHVRDVVDGKLADVGENEMGSIECYRYHCNDCGRDWRYNVPVRLRWLRKIHEQLYQTGEEK